MAKHADLDLLHDDDLADEALDRAGGGKLSNCGYCPNGASRS